MVFVRYYWCSVQFHPLPSTLPSAVPQDERMMMMVLVYLETTGKWEPRKFVSRNENTILMYEPNDEAQPYALSRVSALQEGVYLSRPAGASVFFHLRTIICSFSTVDVIST